MLRLRGLQAMGGGRVNSLKKVLTTRMTEKVESEGVADISVPNAHARIPGAQEGFLSTSLWPIERQKIRHDSKNNAKRSFPNR
jgi:hypothetical protein